MRKKKDAPQKEIEEGKHKIPIEWNVPETITTRFASNLVVQLVEGYFKLSFFEIKPDISLTQPAILPSKIIADCVGSIIMPPHKIKGIIDLLTRQLDRYESAEPPKPE